jgi:hypothetical protein
VGSDHLLHQAARESLGPGRSDGLLPGATRPEALDPEASNRSDPEASRWGCRGPLVIDARIKPHHAPPLVEEPEIERRVDALAAPGGPLHGIY